VSRNKLQGFDEQLKTAYQQAVYRIFQPPISWRIGVLAPEIEVLLHDYKVKTAIFITAANPYSQIFSAQKNKENLLDLEKWIEEKQITAFKGQGEDPQGVWPPEESFLLLGLNAKEGVALGHYWQQNAVVLLETGSPPTLLWC
jgi:hypothetical protein